MPRGQPGRFELYSSPVVAPKETSAKMKKGLLSALSEKELLPSQSVYDNFRRRVSENGRRSEASFFRIAPRADWDDVNLLLQKRALYADIERVLGFGECFTEFLIAPVKIESRFRARVIRLGALANAIGATYDMFVDSRICEPDIISRKTLTRMLSGDASKEHPPRISTPQKIISEMLTQYFRLLRSFCPNDNSKLVTRLLRADIMRLFDAEGKTLAKKRYYLKDVQDLKDKSALLFVIMGLPAWLASDRAEPSQIAEHRKWLYSFGEFIGWIDDIRDLKGDAMHGRPNRLAIWLKANGRRSDRRLDWLVRDLSEKASAIMDGWNSHVIEARHYEQFTMSVTVVSWLGGWRDMESRQSLPPGGAWT
jgi:hypothetical protein